jgi:nucleoside-diphosphate-sugar epimerase
MRISVVGGSGFIGTRLVKRLLADRDHQLGIVDKAMSGAFPERCQIADVRSPEALQQALAETDVIVNLAAEHRDDVKPRSLYDDVNVGGARNLCQVARDRNIKRIIFTSSVAVYGFAPVGTDESGAIAPFNDYGRTKYEAEQLFGEWQREDPANRTLVIIRPTVVFGEQNRGNVYNLLKQIASGRFMMIGSGRNRKSIVYVENVCAFIEHALAFDPGIHVFNFVDQPDFDMNELVLLVRKALGRPEKLGVRLPFWAGLAGGTAFDMVAAVTGRRFPISAVRVRKFCANSVYETAVRRTGFVPPVPLHEALQRTVRHEFLEDHQGDILYYSE